MGKPKISIIMPAYKVEKYISTAIESVISQTFKDWELIIVDDGSPDDSKSIAEKYAEKDDRIRVVSKPNGGLSSARNFGLQYATGEYIHFFDSDDRILPQHYERYLPEVELMPDVIIAGYKVEFLDENEREHKIIERVLYTTDGNKIKVPNLEEVIKFVCYAWNKLFRREFLEKNKIFYEEGLSRIEDAEFMSRFITYNPKVRYIDVGDYVYEQRHEVTLSKGFDSSIIAILKRRKGIDRRLISFFNKGISNKEEEEIEKRLNASALRSAINRLFDSTKDKEIIQKNLKRIKSELLTGKISFKNRNISQQVFDTVTYFGLKHNFYNLINVLQGLRH